jgi:dTMP kinase
MTDRQGVFITLEGGEGSGKTTILKGIIEFLSDKYEVFSTREPGGSRIAEQIREVILNTENTDMDELTEALLYAASRSQHLKEKVLPNLKEGKVVICDRFLDSSLAYQGYARGIGIEKVLKVNEFAVDNCMPDLTIYIDLDPNIGLSRIKQNRRELNRLDMEKIQFHQKVREGYLIVAEMFPERIVTIDGDRTVEEILDEVNKIIINFIQKKRTL